MFRHPASGAPPAPPATLAPAVLVAILVLTGCAAPPGPDPSPAPQPRSPDPAAAPAEPAALPPIPRVDGPLELRLSYPRAGDAISTRDRNFVFGSAGDGDARVWIGGTEVEVRPNGGFLAFLPVPPDGVYRVRAALDGEEQTLEVEVPLPEPVPTGPGILSGSAYPAGAWVVQPGERIEVGFTGTPGGRAALHFGDGTSVPLFEEPVEPGGVTEFEVVPGDPASVAGATPMSRYRGFFTARPVVAENPETPWPTLAEGEGPEPRREAPGAPREGGPEGPWGGHFELRTGGHTLHEAFDANIVVADPHRPRVAVAHDPREPAANGDGAADARPGPGGGPYHYTWVNGTELEVTGEGAGAWRVRLTDDLNAWIPAWQAALEPPGTAPPRSRVAAVRVVPSEGWVDLRVSLDRRLPYLVEDGPRSVTLHVYGATSRVNFLQHGGLDPDLERAEWSQPSDRHFRVDAHLASSPWGHEVAWGEGGDLVLRLRRPPAVDPAAPLRGLRVGVDPGHGGEDRETMGPTGLTEADANLAVALELREALRARGAEVVMTRTTDTTVSLVERTELARARDVDLWVSVHNNAFPDGMDPWANNGTSVYYNHARAAGLARAVQRELVAELGLRDLGTGRADLHQARFTWAPAILTETAFMMIPGHEALLSTPEGQRRVALAHVRGIEAWLRERERR